MDYYRRLINSRIFFGHASRRDQYPFPILLVSIALLLVCLLINYPVYRILLLQAWSGIGTNENVIANLITIQYFVLLFYFIAYLIIAPYVLKIIAQLFNVKITYQLCARLFLYSYLFIILGEFINTYLVFSCGFDNISNPLELIYIGLNVLVPYVAVSNSLYLFLCSLNLFHLMFIFTLFLGLHETTKAKKLKSILISLLLWLIMTFVNVVIAQRTGILNNY